MVFYRFPQAFRIAAGRCPHLKLIGMKDGEILSTHLAKISLALSVLKMAASLLFLFCGRKCRWIAVPPSAVDGT